MNSPAEIDRLVRSCMPLVYKIAKDFHGERVEFDDLVAAGNLGLVEAAQKYDPARGVKFSTYSVHWIRAKMFVVLENADGKRLNRDERKIFYHSKDAYAALGPSASDDEVAAFLGVELEAMIAFRARKTLSLDAPSNNADGGVVDTFVELRVDDTGYSAEDTLVGADTIEEVRQAVANLPPREHLIIQNRFFKEIPKTLRAIGEEDLKISRERVRFLENRAIEKLSRALAKVA